MPSTPSQHLILLGAGFSRNWGGWLANEADEYLLGHPNVDRPVRDILWQFRRTGGFEAALAHLQREGKEKDRLSALQSALRQMFSDMDKAFDGVVFDFNNQRKSTVSEFLTRFDAIFSLNQDLLLERHYLNENVSLMSAGRWNGHALPGLQPINSQPIENVGLQKMRPLAQGYSVPRKAQPYFKLHGSSNWLTDAQGEMLVMGGNKPGIIEKFPLLKWYHEEFRSRLSAPNSKLMVIGYGFGDDHINKTIRDACKVSGLKVFIVDPLGVDALDKNCHAPIYSPSELLQDLWPNLLGASRRSLREVFGADRVEYDKLMRFFSQ